MVVAISSSSVSIVSSIEVGIEGCRSLTHVGVCPAEDIVGTHAFVGSAVAIEILHQLLGERVVGHYGVGTVLPLQLLELGAHLTAIARTGGEDNNQ